MYSNTLNWKPHIRQKISFKLEHNKNYDKFAVADKTLLKARIVAVTVGHVPRELSRQTWYAIQKGAKFQATVYDTKAKPLPLIQGGLEIPIKVKIIWSQEEKLLKFKAKVEKVKEEMYNTINSYYKYTSISKSSFYKINILILPTNTGKKYLKYSMHFASICDYQPL